MVQGEITFDRVARWTLVAIGVAVAYYLLDTLSDVLWQFFLAWVLAYFAYPVVRFLEVKCHVPWRAVSILLTIVIVLSVFTVLGLLTIPPMVREMMRLTDDVVYYTTAWVGESGVYEQIMGYINERLTQDKVVQILTQNNTLDALKYLYAEAWDLVLKTTQILVGLLNVFVVFLYFFFILLDYETISEGWSRLLPKGQRSAAVRVVEDVRISMNRYFRGQGLIALLVGILFSIGFLIVGLPMAVGVGLFIGLLNMVPYMQMLGIFPVVVLALLKSSDTGQSFWVIMGLCAIVFVVVQALQDMVLTPKIMGSAMGLNPAIILLSLSVWGCLLGFIGLVIALPLTVLCFAYYKRFVLKEE